MSKSEKQKLKSLKKELDELTKEIDEDVYLQFLHGDLEFDCEENTILKNCELKDNYGGEGQGDSYWAVWYFPSLNIHVQFDGWYQSHYGSEYEDCFIVYPQEVKRIEYVRIQETK